MKSLAALIIIAIITSNTAIAESVTAFGAFNYKNEPSNRIVAKTICLEGYVFAIVASGKGENSSRNVSMTQLLMVNPNQSGTIKPKQCETAKP